MYLVINTKTIGYPRLDLPLSHILQPVIRQLSAIVFDDDGNEIDMISAPRPLIDLSGSGSSLPQNEVTLAQARGEYVHPLAVFAWFLDWADRCDMIVGHNAHFDLHAMRVIGARCGGVEWIPSAAIFCTMISSAPLLKLPKDTDPLGSDTWQFRAPTISECLDHFWGVEYPEPESTLASVRACNRIFRKIVPEV